MVERTKSAPRGFGGGGAGRAAQVLLDGAPVDPKQSHTLAPGQTFVLETPGGGGYGPSPKGKIMPKKAIESDKVAKTKGPYVQGVEVTNAKLVYTSGVVARDAKGAALGVGDIRVQTRQCIENIRNILEAAGGSLKDLVKVTVFLRPGTDYAAMNDVRRELLTGIEFASSTVMVGLNAPEALIEVEAVGAISIGHRKILH